MDQTKISEFKSNLEAEKKQLEAALKTVGARNPENPEDWEAKTQALDTDKAERTEVADRVSGFETNLAILNDLEIKYNEVKAALARIEEGTFGVCEVCGKAIEEDRLKANPAATTCKAHMNNKPE